MGLVFVGHFYHGFAYCNNGNGLVKCRKAKDSHTFILCLLIFMTQLPVFLDFEAGNWCHGKREQEELYSTLICVYNDVYASIYDMGKIKAKFHIFF